MGVETAIIDRADIGRTSIDILVPKSHVEKTEVDTVNYKMVRRGVIGINKIGYFI